MKAHIARYLIFITPLLLTAVSLFGQAPTQVHSLDETHVIQTIPGSDINQIAQDHSAIITAAVEPLATYRLQGADLTSLENDSRIISAKEEQLLEARPIYIVATGDMLEAKPIYIVATGDSPVEAYQGQSGISQLRLDRAHALSTGTGTIVAVLDTGFDLDHPLIVDHLIPGYDFVNNDDDPSEDIDGIDSDNDSKIDEALGHGSHVAGIVALAAPDAQIMPLRIFDSDGNGTYFDAAAAIVYAVDNGADVINLSGNGATDDASFRNAVAYAWNNGVIVAAAGGINNLGYPAGFDNVLSVGSVDELDYRLDFAVYAAERPLVYAPGYAIYSAYSDGGYAWWTGNSMATPFVAGEAALLLATGQCDHACTFNAITQSEHPLDGGQAGLGAADVYDALTKALNQPDIDLQLQYQTGEDDLVNDQVIKPYFVMNNSGSSLDLDDISFRYWFTADDDVEHITSCDYAMVGCDKITAVTYLNDTPDSSHYLEVSFEDTAGTLFGDSETGELQLRLNQSDWSSYDEADDYSYTTANTFTNSEQITAYYQGELIWGQEPGSPEMSAPGTAQVKAQYATSDPDALNNFSQSNLKIVNTSDEPIPLSQLTLRYWYTTPYQEAPIPVCDYATLDCNKITAVSHHDAPKPYLELSFSAQTGNLESQADTGVIKLRFHQPNWQAYDETTHYSFDSSKTTFTDWEHITLYQNGQLVWGIEP